MTSFIRKVLVLDDDVFYLSDVARVLKDEGYHPICCSDVDSAERALDGLDFAIVDLFLQGDEGDQLSNGFVESQLIPRSIPFCRMTSAPALVPPALGGLAVIHKRRFQDDPEALLSLLRDTFGR